MEKRIELNTGDLRLVDLLSSPSKLKTLESIKDSHVTIDSRDPITASYIVNLISNTNKVILVNSIVIKSLDPIYTIGELYAWFKDITTIKLD